MPWDGTCITLSRHPHLSSLHRNFEFMMSLSPDSHFVLYFQVCAKVTFCRTIKCILFSQNGMSFHLDLPVLSSPVANACLAIYYLMMAMKLYLPLEKEATLSRSSSVTSQEGLVVWEAISALEFIESFAKKNGACCVD